jgi:hypothetical protein
LTQQGRREQRRPYLDLERRVLEQLLERRDKEEIKSAMMRCRLRDREAERGLSGTGRTSQGPRDLAKN